MEDHFTLFLWFDNQAEAAAELMNNPAKAGRVTDAFLKMKKFDIEKLKAA
jgi:predicted 3-demethylubiquinone-9 3-methyltransferase (glyoxalase superfamily)